MFSPEIILNFEQLDTLADIYAVESSLFANEESRVADYVSDIAQVKKNWFGGQCPRLDGIVGIIEI